LVADASCSNGADLLIRDTAPNADQTALRAAQLADVVLIPCRAATFDLEAIQATLTLVGERLSAAAPVLVQNGSSPRARGTHVQAVYQALLARLIPAYAGNATMRRRR